MPRNSKRRSWTSSDVRTLKTNGTKENTGGEHRPELKAHRRCYSAEGFQFGAIAQFASLISATPLDEVKAPPLCGAFLMRQLRQRRSGGPQF